MKISVLYTITKEKEIEVDDMYKKALDADISDLDYYNLESGLCTKIYKEIGPDIGINAIYEAESGEVMFEPY